MGSSNRHWPSMFKSKPCNPTHHQWQQNDLNSSLISTPCHRTPYTPGPGCEERTPEPKPRWNPRPEQIRILEAIFNSGMVNPPRDEIRKIRVQLQEFGQVGDANVFYWFQNRKSRSKHKLRQLQNTKSQPQQTTTTTTTAPPPPPAAAFLTAPSSSSSSSDKSSPNNSNEKVISVGSIIHHDHLLNSPTASVNQFQASNDFLNEPFFFPVQQNSTGGSSISANLTQGFSFPDVNTDQSVGNCTSFLLSELMLMNNNCSSKKDNEDEKLKLQQNFSYSITTAPNSTAQHIVPPPLCVPSPTNYIIQGVGEQGPTKSTVFINDVCFEVGVGPFNVREAFGDDAVLIQSTGHPVLTNEWGVTLEPLRHGAFYYLVRAFTPSPHERSTIDLI